MKNQLLQEIASSNSLSTLGRPPRRNLGCAILAAAITDYQSGDDPMHASAKKFLFPSTEKYREHYDWAVAMADGVNRQWLREALNSARAQWDLERGLARRHTTPAERVDSPNQVGCIRHEGRAAHHG